jgi:hypothetical protein
MREDDASEDQYQRQAVDPFGRLAGQTHGDFDVYAAGVNPASVDWATSNSPTEPWTHGGRILDPLPDAGPDPATSHPGVAEFAGQWYFVYHVSDGPNGGGTYRHNVAVDKLNFNSDGSIQPVTPSSGLTF